jgi:hypothetical protein
MKTANGQTVRLGQHVKTARTLNCETSIVKRIDTENEAVFVVPLDGGYGGWYSVSTIISTT